MYGSRRLRVFEDDTLAPLVLANKLPVSTAEELLVVADADRRGELAQQAVAEGWSAPRCARLCASVSQRYNPTDRGGTWRGRAKWGAWSASSRRQSKQCRSRSCLRAHGQAPCALPAARFSRRRMTFAATELQRRDGSEELALKPFCYIVVGYPPCSFGSRVRGRLLGGLSRLMV
jgi:hypothetical protein